MTWSFLPDASNFFIFTVLYKPKFSWVNLKLWLALSNSWIRQHLSNKQKDAPRELMKGKVVNWQRRRFSSFAQSCPTLCNPMDCSTAGFPVHYQLPELAETRVHWVSDAIQPSNPLSFPSPAVGLSKHQGLFQWVSSLHQVAKVLKLPFQHQSFQWILRFDFL